MTTKKSIAFVANTSWSIYKFRLYLIERLIENGYSIYVLAPRDSYTARFSDLPGLTYIELKKLRAKSLSPIDDLELYRELKRHYRRLKPDLIFHYTIKANIFGTLAAASARIPSISVITGLGYTFAAKGWLQALVRILYTKTLHRNAEVWFLNEDDLHTFLSGQLVAPGKTFLLPGEGIDTNSFPPTPYEEGKKEVTFLFVGRMIRYKGIFEFVRAAELLQQRGLTVRCQILGFFDENPAAISRRQLDRWTTKGIVDYLGSSDEVASYIGRADCIVLPSYYQEGIPMSLLEGASMCKALIAADTPGCRTIIEPGVNGYLCLERSAADLAEKMTNYYNLPAAGKRRMGIAGRNKVLQGFTREAIVNIYLNRIHILLETRH